jgi:hypothetical protein
MAIFSRKNTAARPRKQRKCLTFPKTVFSYGLKLAAFWGVFESKMSFTRRKKQANALRGDFSGVFY